jgi:hypothetical protein
VYGAHYAVGERLGVRAAASASLSYHTQIVFFGIASPFDLKPTEQIDGLYQPD